MNSVQFSEFFNRILSVITDIEQLGIVYAILADFGVFYREIAEVICKNIKNPPFIPKIQKNQPVQPLLSLLDYFIAFTLDPSYDFPRGSFEYVFNQITGVFNDFSKQVNREKDAEELFKTIEKYIECLNESDKNLLYAAVEKVFKASKEPVKKEPTVVQEVKNYSRTWMRSAEEWAKKEMMSSIVPNYEDNRTESEVYIVLIEEGMENLKCIFCKQHFERLSIDKYKDCKKVERGFCHPRCLRNVK